jgi:pilus assembly protein CpaE
MTGIKFAHFLADLDPHRQLVATGPQLSPDLLLEAMRAGISEYLPKPVTPEALRTGVYRVMRKLGWTPSGGPQQTGRLYALFSPKGGSGCTTVATNLAIVLHRLTGKKTLLLDLDLELGDTGLLLGVEPRFSLLDVVRNFHRMDAGLLASFVERHESGVHLLSAPDYLDRPEPPADDQIRTILHFVKQQYTHVVVDTCNSLTPGALAALAEADRILVVTNLDLPSLRNLQRCLPMLERTVGKAARERVRIVVNRFSGDDVISLSDVHRTLGMKVYRTLSNDYAAVSRSINGGKPVVLNGRSRYTRDLWALGADLLGLPRGSRAGRGPHARWRFMGALWRRLRRQREEAGAS